jgi:N-acetylmuramoyl-L-alanine amidase
MKVTKIGVRAGHNCPPGDTGAIGNGVREDDVVKAVSTKFIQLLDADGFNVINCNPASANTVNSSLLQGVTRANEASVGLFVSIHANSFKQATAKGVEVYYFEGNSEGELLAKLISNNLALQLETTNRGAKTANFYELRATNCTAVLIELGFLSNPKEAKLLEESTDKMAETIFKSLKAWNNGTANYKVIPEKLSYVAPAFVANEHEELNQVINYEEV